MKRNKELEVQIEREPIHFYNDSNLIAALQQTIKDLKGEKNHQLNIYNTEQEDFNKEAANLQYQLSVIKIKKRNTRQKMLTFMQPLKIWRLLANKLTEANKKSK